MPVARTTGVCQLAFVIGSILVFADLLFLRTFWLGAVAALVAALLLRFLPRTLPVETLGQLAQTVAVCNYAALSLQGGDERERSVWNAYVAVIRQKCIGDDAIDITLDMRIET